MTDKTAEVKRIVDLYENKENRPYPYGDLPAAENFIPLQKYPPQAALTEKIGNTEYTLNAHFQTDGRDLLYYLSQLILHGVDPNIYRE